MVMKLVYTVAFASILSIFASQSNAASYHVKENGGVNIQNELTKLGIAPKEIVKMTSNWYEIKDVDPKEAALMMQLKGKALQRIEKEDDTTLKNIFS
jgi:hypothetical protein